MQFSFDYTQMFALVRIFMERSLVWYHFFMEKIFHKKMKNVPKHGFDF